MDAGLSKYVEALKRLDASREDEREPLLKSLIDVACARMFEELEISSLDGTTTQTTRSVPDMFYRQLLQP